MKAKIELLFIPVVFALTIFVQCVLFHYLIYKEILLSTLWHSPVDFFRFYLPAATMAVFFSSFVFLFKNKWWTVVVSIFFNLWIWANLWYYRANGILIDKYAVSMIGNLNGFWDSILALIRPADFAFLCLTLLLAIFIYIFKSRGQKSIITFAISMILSIVMGLANGMLLVIKYKGDWSYMNPFREIVHHYVKDYSVIHLLLLTGKECALFQEEDKYELTTQEINRTNQFISIGSSPHNDDKALIICLIESLNSFVITEEIMPNLRNFIDSSNNILLCESITSQIKGGGSADGQMIIQSGLLPVEHGAACYRFAFNKYPALPHILTNSAIIYPHEPHVWNQSRMSSAYGITKDISDQSDNDKDLFNMVIKQSNYYQYVMMMTMSTHIPCTLIADSSYLSILDSVPTLLRNYIKSVNVLDRGIKVFIDSLSHNKRLKNTTIVITGDHCLPVPSDEDFGGAYGYSRFIPLIIYSPEIKQKTIITDTCYQMDIYPTILHLIGCEDYYWKGFGVNLLDSAARHNRPITPEEAYDLSDKIIRADYFRKFEEQ